MTSAVAYASPYVPAGWIEAHGLRPVRVTPRTSESVWLEPGVCPYCQSFADTVASMPDVVAVVMTTTCDQMRRMFERVGAAMRAPVFLLNIPATVDSPHAHALYCDELARLGRFLQEAGGQAPSNPRALFGSPLNAQRTATSCGHAGCGVPLAIVGAPWRDDFPEARRAIESAGGAIVFDATESGDEWEIEPRDRPTIETTENRLDEWIKACLNSIPGIFRRPNDRFYSWLVRETQARQVRGVIFHRYTWCDLWHAERERVREALGLPLVDIEVGEGGLLGSRILTRIQAFIESLP